MTQQTVKLRDARRMSQAQVLLRNIEQDRAAYSSHTIAHRQRKTST
jgi:hypothetical protein